MTAQTQTMRAASVYRSTVRRLTDTMREFLVRQPFATLATHNHDGSIHLVPVWFLFDEGRFYVATWSRSRKARNVADRPQVAITVDDRDTAEWVSATGPAELLGGERSAQVNDRLRRKYMTDVGLETIGPLMQGAEDATIAIEPHQWKAWDYESTLLAAIQNAGVPLDSADSWYRP